MPTRVKSIEKEGKRSQKRGQMHDPTKFPRQVGWAKKIFGENVGPVSIN